MRVATALRCVPPSRGWTNPLTMTATDRRRASSLVSCAKCGGTFIFDCVACAGGRCARALFVALIFLESTTREPPSSCAHETKPWARPPPPRCRGHPPPPTTRDAQQSTGPVARHRSPRGMQSFILATEGGGVVAPPRRLRARRLAGGESAGVVAAAAVAAMGAAIGAAVAAAAAAQAMATRRRHTRGGLRRWALSPGVILRCPPSCLCWCGRRLPPPRYQSRQPPPIPPAAALPRPPWGLVDGVGGGDPAAKKATFATAATARGSRPCPPPTTPPPSRPPNIPPPLPPQPSLEGVRLASWGAVQQKKGGRMNNRVAIPTVMPSPHHPHA